MSEIAVYMEGGGNSTTKKQLCVRACRSFFAPYVRLLAGNASTGKLSLAAAGALHTMRF